MKYDCAYDVKEKRIVSAKQALRKRQCTCICPYCLEHLAVKTTDSGKSYFVHNTSSSAECDAMMVRLLAQKFFRFKHDITITMGTLLSEMERYVVHFNKYLNIPGCTEVTYKISGVEVYKRIGDIVPDITLYTDKGEVYIGFKLKDDTPEYKVAQYRYLGNVAIELDLSELLESDIISLNQVWSLLEKRCSELDYRVLYQPLIGRQRRILDECMCIDGVSNLDTCKECPYFVASVAAGGTTNKVYCRKGLLSLDAFEYKLDRAFTPYIDYVGTDDECLADEEITCGKIGE